jgi:hypothetical protein
MRVSKAMAEDHAAIERLRALRARLKSIQERGAGSVVAKAAAALDAKAALLEGSAGGFEGGPGRSREGFSGLNGQLASLLDVLQNADAKPTAAAAAAIEDLEKTLAGQLLRLRELETQDVRDFNADLAKAGLPPLSVSETPPSRP